MKKETKLADVGVIIGRFQVENLTEAHTKLIESVMSKHEKVIIFLGVPGISPVPSTKRYPLDFEMRKQMIEEKFGNRIIISHVKNMKEDTDWSKQLDNKIADLVSPKQSVILYGGRDSFIQYYHGKYNTEELEPEVYTKISGTKVREKIKNKAEPSAAFRAGVIWANENQYDHAIAVIDIAILNEDCTKVLLGQKPDEKCFRFFGGFVDTSRDTSYEMTARREAKEESGVSVTDPIYICSRQIKDWRYQNEGDKVYTTFFVAKYQFGSIMPGDDIDKCKWFPLDETTLQYLAAEHEFLYQQLIQNLFKIKNEMIFHERV